MTPDPTIAEDQGETSSLPQPLSDVYISPAAQRLLGIRMESNGGGPAQTAAPTGAEGGQGQGAAGAQSGANGGGFNWEMFPGVPEEQRPLLEPHLRSTMGHVTKLEQTYAPYKSVIDAGLSADDLNGLVALNQAFDKDPVGTWLSLAENMQKQGALSDDLDLDAVKLVLEGKAELDPGTDAGEGQQVAGGEEEPQWAKEIRDQFKSQQEKEAEAEQSKTAEAQQQQLDQTLTGMKAQLKEAGYTDEQLGAEGFDDLLTSAIITARGNPDEALKQIILIRNSTLKGLAGKTDNSGKPEDLEMPNGAPKTPQRTRGGREFAKARQGAAQFLERQKESGATE